MVCNCRYKKNIEAKYGIRAKDKKNPAQAPAESNYHPDGRKKKKPKSSAGADGGELPQSAKSATGRIPALMGGQVGYASVTKSQRVAGT